MRSEKAINSEGHTEGGREGGREGGVRGGVWRTASGSLETNSSV